MRFGIPRSDPRYLDATEEDVISDMLAAMYTDGEIRRGSDPGQKTKEEAERNPQPWIDAHDRLRRQLAAGGKLRQRIAAWNARRGSPKGVSVTRIRGSVTT